MSFFQEKDGGLLLSIYVQPKSSQNQIVGLYNGALKIKITAPPVDCEANEAIVKFLAKTFKRPQRDFGIVSGQTSRHKKIFLQSAKIQDSPADILAFVGQ